MPRISQLPALTVPEANDEIAIVDASAATTKKITREDFLKGAALPADTVDTQSIADGAITAPKIDFTTLNFGNYSTSEVDTGFKWIDGKAIYKKTVSLGALPNNATKTVSAPTPYDRLISEETVVQTTDSIKTSFSLAFINNSGDRAYTTVTVDGVGITTNSDRSSYTGFTTIWYTKE